MPAVCFGERSVYGTGDRKAETRWKTQKTNEAEDGMDFGCVFYPGFLFKFFAAGQLLSLIHIYAL